MSKLKMRNESFVIVPNVAFGFGGDFHLTKDEMMVYVHLQFVKQIGLENTTRTNVDMLIDDLGWGTSTPSRDKKNMVSILETLENKGFIKIDCDGKMSKSILTISINENMKNMEAETIVDWKEKPFTFKGVTKVTGDNYNLAEGNGYKIIVIAYVLWRENAQFQYQIAFKEWESVLGVSDKTARTIIDDCDSIINKDEHGQLKQEPNSYSVKSQKSDVKSKVSKIESDTKATSTLDKKREQVTDIKVMSDNNIFKQIFDKKTFIKLEGYKVWKETECKVVKEAGQSKINAMKASENTIAGEIAERLEREYQEHLSEQSKKQEWLKIQITNYDYDDMWIPSYKKKEESSFNIFED